MAPVTLVRGKPATIERALVDHVGQSRAHDSLAPMGVLIGGTLLRPYLQRLLAAAHGGIANVHFLMPSEFALALGERRLVAQGKRPLPPLADRVLMRELAQGQDGYFAPVREMPGFATALFHLSRELRGAGYDASTFAAAIAGVCDSPAKGEALAAVLEQFLARRDGFYGPDDCLLSADVAAKPWCELLVYGLWEMPAALRETVAALAEHIPVTVFLPRTGTAADGAVEPLASALTAVGAVEQVPSAAPMRRAGLTHVQDKLFTRDSSGPMDGTVRLASALEPAREVREAARACLGWAADGIALHEMAIAYRHADEYRPIVESIFAEARLPLYLHEGTPLIERPVGRQAAALIGLIDGNLERRAVMDFLTDTRLPDATRDKYGNAPVTRWDRFSRDAGIVEGLEQWRSRLAGHREELHRGRPFVELDEWQQRNVGRLDALASFIDDFARALSDHADIAPWSEHLAGLERLLRRYIDLPDPIVDALDGLQRFDALAGNVRFDSFLAIVREAIETLRSDDVRGGTAPGAFARRGVNVIDVNSLRHLSFRAVAVVGLAERSFPSPPRQDPLLLDHERSALNERGRGPVPLRARGADPEPLQFDLAVHAAHERLLLTYPRKGADGRPQLPSVFFRAAAEAMTGERVTAERVDDLPADLYRRVPGGTIGAASPTVALSRAEHDRTLIEREPDLGRALIAASEPRLARALEARRAALRGELTEWDGLLTENGRALMHAHWDPDRPLSPSSLQTYAECPQRYFMSSLLRVNPVDEPEAVRRMSALDRGSLIHKILERFLSEPPQHEPVLHGPGEERRLQTIVAEECDTAEQRGESGYALMWRYDREQIADDMQRWLEREREDPSFTAMPDGRFEVAFADWEDAAEQPVEIVAGDARVRVHGRIDRLNWDPKRTSYRVIDYKTGKVRGPDDGGLDGGQALQLPIYLLAGSAITGIPPEAGRAEYHFATRAGGFVRKTFTGDDLRERGGDLDLILGTLARGIRDGVFHMAPPEERTCEYCDYNTLCPAARARRIERKSEDPRAAEHLALREIP